MAVRENGSLSSVWPRLCLWEFPVVAVGCPCVEWLAVGEAGLSAVIARSVVALCSVSLVGAYGLMADCCLVDASASCSFSLAWLCRLSLRLSLLAFLPACMSVSPTVPARDPVAHG